MRLMGILAFERLTYSLSSQGILLGQAYLNFDCRFTSLMVTLGFQSISSIPVLYFSRTRQSQTLLRRMFFNLDVF